MSTFENEIMHADHRTSGPGGIPMRNAFDMAAHILGSFGATESITKSPLRYEPDRLDGLGAGYQLDPISGDLYYANNVMPLNGHYLARTWNDMNGMDAEQFVNKFAQSYGDPAKGLPPWQVPLDAYKDEAFGLTSDLDGDSIIKDPNAKRHGYVTDLVRLRDMEGQGKNKDQLLTDAGRPLGWTVFETMAGLLPALFSQRPELRGQILKEAEAQRTRKPNSAYSRGLDMIKDENIISNDAAMRLAKLQGRGGEILHKQMQLAKKNLGPYAAMRGISDLRTLPTLMMNNPNYEALGWTNGYSILMPLGEEWRDVTGGDTSRKTVMEDKAWLDPGMIGYVGYNRGVNRQDVMDEAAGGAAPNGYKYGYVPWDSEADEVIQGGTYVRPKIGNADTVNHEVLGHTLNNMLLRWYTDTSTPERFKEGWDRYGQRYNGLFKTYPDNKVNDRIVDRLNGWDGSRAIDSAGIMDGLAHTATGRTYWGIPPFGQPVSLSRAGDEAVAHYIGGIGDDYFRQDPTSGIMLPISRDEYNEVMVGPKSGQRFDKFIDTRDKDLLASLDERSRKDKVPLKVRSFPGVRTRRY